MGEVVNLRRERKRQARGVAEEKAAENRVRFGRTGAQKAADRAEAERTRRAHEGAELKPE